MFDYDSWLESPYTSGGGGHSHHCYECDGKAKLWLEEEQRFDENFPCEKCDDGRIECWDDCYDEPEDDD
jgi:hypothetical protein